jgi:threonine/homoserine/homoserine lactone efflux protein
MTLEATLAFSFAFLLLALVPGAGLAIILSRALGGGFANGLAVTTGLIIGDFIFMGIAIVGLSALANSMGSFFNLLKYAGALYLLWLGLKMILSDTKQIEVSAQTGKNLFKDVIMGLIVTLGNPKPILFYGSFLPTFLDLTRVTLSDYLTMGLIITLISFVVYGVFIALTLKAKTFFVSSKATKRLDQAVGVMFLGSSLYVVTR